MTQRFTIYPSKVLLFGEYTVLKNSTALAVPNVDYFGQWTSKASNDIDILFNWILDNVNFKPQTYDRDQLKRDIGRTTFQSNIPLGYGLGSSGALTAAVFDRYFKFENSDAQTLTILQKIESFFHGNSSGIDPMVSLWEKPILLKNGDIKVLNDVEFTFTYELLDSGQTRSTTQWVNYFKDQIKDPRFNGKIEQMSELNQSIIETIVEGTGDLITKLDELSQLQFDVMQAWIPESICQIWKESLDEEDSFVKLCGAGGGGYFLKIRC